MPIDLSNIGPDETRNLLMQALERLRGGQSQPQAAPVAPVARARAGGISLPAALGSMPSQYFRDGAAMSKEDYLNQLNYGHGAPGSVLEERIGITPMELERLNQPALDVARRNQSSLRTDALKKLLQQLQQRIGGTPNSQPMTMASVLGNYRRQIGPMRNDLASLMKGF